MKAKGTAGTRGGGSRIVNQDLFNSLDPRQQATVHELIDVKRSTPFDVILDDRDRLYMRYHRGTRTIAQQEMPTYSYNLIRKDGRIMSGQGYVSTRSIRIQAPSGSQRVIAEVKETR